MLTVASPRILIENMASFAARKNWRKRHCGSSESDRIVSIPAKDGRASHIEESKP